ncbi:2OG-Fe dioxygenase family protein [Nostoc muscorum FACHB-395]|nr:2OG-Fe dioxygenase family protein [Desmonostoc muscorum FACHB-395]
MTYSLLMPKALNKEIKEQIINRGFSIIQGCDFKSKFLFEETIWQEFRQSWNNLELDKYMNDNGKYRYRRYSVFQYNELSRTLFEKQREPHYQQRNFNELNGGINRYYEPLEERTKANLVFVSIIDFWIKLFTEIKPNRDWHLEVHQFRITTNSDFSGLPTPEGIHRDGVTYAFIMLAGKENVIGGESYIYDSQKKPILSYILEKSLDCALLDDIKLRHSVSPISPCLTAKEGYRDTLVITFTEL